MASTSDIQIVPLDFDSIRADLRRFLSTQSEFRDYNFEGSALSLLLDILSYDAYYHGWYTNFAVNETFLQTAQLRNSVVAAARQVGYVPRSIAGSVAEVDITIDTIAPNEGSFIFPKYTPFTTTVSGNTFTFYTINDETIASRGNTTATLSAIPLYEGTLVTQTYTITTQNYSNTGTILSLLNQNTDTRTVSVSVKPDINSSISYPYIPATSAVGISGTSNVFFLFETNRGDYEIQFGDGRLGRNLSLGQQVTIRYLVSRGSASIGANAFSYAGDAVGTINPTNNVTASLSNINIPAYGGAPRESIESIKRNAPNIYRTQNRVVTPEDAKALLLADISGIDSVAVWGGEINDPPTYGKLFICAKPINALRFGPTQKSRFAREILRPRSSPILSFEFVDPDYIYLVSNSLVRYNASLTAFSQRELQQQIITKILDYSLLQLGQFGSFFRYSQFLSLIDNAEISIQSSTTDLILEKRITITAGQTSYTVKYSNPIYRESIMASPSLYADIIDEETRRITAAIQDIGLVNISDLPARQAYAEQIIRAAIERSTNTAQKFAPVSVTSKVGAQLFTHPNESGFREEYCWIQNEGDVIHVYKTDADSVIRKVKSNVGTVNFDTGNVHLTNFSPSKITTSLENELKLHAVPLNMDVAPVRDQIILLPRENINVSVIEDSQTPTNTITGRNRVGIRTGV